MESRVLARIAAIVFIAFAVTATVVEMTRQEREPSLARPASVHQPPVDSLRAGQRRCQQMGEAAANDPVCLQVWSETRDRFLGRTPDTAAPRRTEER